MAQAARRRSARPPERDDPPVASGSSLTVLTALRAYKAEAQKAREPRLKQTRRNWDVFLGQQDWSHKQAGQSRELLPKVAMAKEQIGAFIERGLTDFGDWFALELYHQRIMTNDQARKLLQYHLDHGATNGVTMDEDFPALVADAVTVALLGALAIFKVHGRTVTERVFRAERGYQYIPMPDGSVVPQITSELIRREVETWQLVIDLVPPEDYLPDPKGRGLYEMHEVERDLWEVQAMAEAGVYDPAVVRRIEEDYAREEERSYSTREQDRQDRLQANPGFRYRVVILEAWGTILDEKGRKAEQNIVAAMANNKYLIRPPEPNFYWHGERPFVSRPLVRVPFSVWHKALFDHAVDLNISLNELYNLMLDGAIASVWGTKQVRPEWLEDPRQISAGIPQGETLVVKDGAPTGAKVLEQLTTGQVPAEAMAMFQATQQELEVATQVNAVRLGQTPSRQTTATAVVEAQSQSNSFFDGMIRDVEKTITKALYLSWCNIMQFLQHADGQEVITAVGERAAVALASMSPAERYEAFAGCKIKVSGLSSIVSRVRDFQKMLALLNVSAQNPMMAMSFAQRFSPVKIWNYLFKALNIDPSTLEPDEQEQAQQPQMLALLQQQMLGARGGAGGQGEAAVPPEEGAAALPVERMPATGMGASS
jgi:hypothetical protein